jgi:hypothetical protein
MLNLTYPLKEGVLRIKPGYPCYKGLRDKVKFNF